MKEGFKKIWLIIQFQDSREKQTGKACNYTEAFDSMLNAVALSTL